MFRKLSVGLLMLLCNGAYISAEEKNIVNEIATDELTLCYLSDEAKVIIADTTIVDSVFNKEGLSCISSLTLPLVYRAKIEPLNWKGLSNGSVYEKISDIAWLDNALFTDRLISKSKNKVLSENARIARFDFETMEVGPTLSKLATEATGVAFDYTVPPINATALKIGLPKADRWVTSMKSAIQFSQNHVSDNWYQGGESNINVLSIQNFGVKFFDEKGKTEFETTIDLKTGFYTTEADTMRPFRVNDNLLQINSKYGYKAFRRWYYATAVNFKTQIFDNYKANTDELLNQFLSPAEINFSVGMDYKFENKKKSFNWSMLLAPVSYNLKYVANIDEIDETRYGIDEGKHSLSQVGSSFTNKFTWKISKSIVWTSRLYYFTNYESVQGDFENVFDFVISKFFSTKIQTHLRLDDTTKEDLFQFKEMLSFGFNYIW